MSERRVTWPHHCPTWDSPGGCRCTISTADDLAVAGPVVDRDVLAAVRTLLPGLRVANYVERWATGSPAVQALSALSEFVGEGPVAAGETVDPDVLSAHARRPAGEVP